MFCIFFFSPFIYFIFLFYLNKIKRSSTGFCSVSICLSVDFLFVCLFVPPEVNLDNLCCCFSLSPLLLLFFFYSFNLVMMIIAAVICVFFRLNIIKCMENHFSLFLTIIILFHFIFKFKLFHAHNKQVKWLLMCARNLNLTKKKNLRSKSREKWELFGIHFFSFVASISIYLRTTTTVVFRRW